MFKKGIIYVAAAVLGVAAALGLSAVFMVIQVTGEGMEPAYGKGRVAVVNKLPCSDAGAGSELGSIDAGDVVAFKCDVHSEDGEGSILVRRVAGVSGDVLEIRDNIFYRNGKPYEEYMTEAAHMEEMKSTRLDAGEIFVLNDNRKFSMDSRNEAIGVLNTGDCIGKVCF